jgi:hypothetical protein
MLVPRRIGRILSWHSSGVFGSSAPVIAPCYGKILGWLQKNSPVLALLHHEASTSNIGRASLAVNRRPAGRFMEVG